MQGTIYKMPITKNTPLQVHLEGDDHMVDVVLNLEAGPTFPFTGLARYAAY
jgi:hypothetical protein